MLLFTRSAESIIQRLADFASMDGRVSKENASEILHNLVRAFSVGFLLLGIVLGMIISAVVIAIVRLFVSIQV
jgi:hypothetical protein